jgi:hypothetical protein
MVSVGHSKQDLHQSRSRKLLRWLGQNAAAGTGDIQTLKVFGYTDDEDARSRLSLDLLEDLISFQEHLVLPDDDAAENFLGRRRFIDRAFSANETDLSAYKEI